MTQSPKGPTRSAASGEAAPVERSIFRAEALRHFQENQDKVVLPPLASPRVFFYLWVLAGVTLVVGMLLACWPWIEPLVSGAT